MVDANYLQYGTDALRVTDTMGDMAEFGSQNGEALGALIAVFIILFIIVGVLAILVRYGKVFLQ